MIAKRTAGRCRRCGCTDLDCTGCVERTGRPCHWAEPDLCSACLPRFEVLGVQFVLDAGPEVEFAGGYVCRPGGDPEWCPLDHPGGWPAHLIEVWLPAELWAIARRVLPALAKRGRLTL